MREVRFAFNPPIDSTALSEYKMLVHVTEVLLNERNVRKESERKLQSKKEREYLERDFADARIDENGIGVVIANGNSSAS